MSIEILKLFAYTGKFCVFLSSADYFVVKINSGIPSECKTVQIQIKAILSGLILVQTVFKGHKQTTLVG